jgi:protocatechuate 3,4-dioxygenase beta subunit
VKSALSTKRAFVHILAGCAVFLTAFLTHSLFASASPRAVSDGFVGPDHLELSAAAQNTNQQAVSPGTVSGHVFRGDTGEPLSKATIVLTESQGGGRGQNLSFPQATFPQITRSASDGSFNFENVTPGKYTARADHIGYIAQSYGQVEGMVGSDLITVGPGQNLSKIDFKLGPAGIISGTILDEDHDPLENVQVAAVRVRYAKGGARQEVPIHSVLTDDRGNYRLFGLVPGFYYIRVQSGGNGIQTVGPESGTAYRPTYYPGTGNVDDAQRIQVAPGVETPGISFSVGTQSTHSIRGTVIDTSGQSASRRYMLSANRTGNSSGNSGPVFFGQQSLQITSPDGSFAISGVSSGDYTVVARSIRVTTEPGGSFSSMNVEQDVGFAPVRVADGDARVNVVVSPPSEVKGRVIVEGTQQPPPGKIRISIQSMGGSPPAFGNQSGASIDDSGNFDIKGIGPGQYTFSIGGAQNLLYLKRATCSGRDYTVQPLALESTINLNDCVVTLGTDAGSISGQVLDSGKPVQGLVVVAIPDARDLRTLPRFIFNCKTDADGNFQLPGVIPGDYLVFAVPASDEQIYFAPDFAEKNIRDAERITIHASENKTVNPRPSPAQ